MSVRAMAVVWESNLRSDLKFVALALADVADEDGGNVFPSQATVARKVGKTDRSVRDSLGALQEACVLREVGWPEGRLHPPTKRYELDLAAVAGLPKGTPWTVKEEPAEADEPTECATDCGERPETVAALGSERDPETVSTTTPATVSGGAEIIDIRGRKPTSGHPGSPLPTIHPDPSSDPISPPVSARVTGSSLFDYLQAARAEVAGQRGKPGPVLSDDERGVLAYLHSRASEVIAGADAPVTGWCEDLARRGLTRSDVDYGIGEAAPSAGVRKGLKYLRGVLLRRVEEREAGHDPDRRGGDGRRDAGGSGRGGVGFGGGRGAAGRGRGARGGTGVAGRYDRPAGGGGVPAGDEREGDELDPAEVERILAGSAAGAAGGAGGTDA